jgi:DNA processing protein
LLRYLGSLDWQKKTALAVVGTREPHRISLQWMEENLAGVVKSKDLVLVSGGARGIDQMAHKISLRAQQPTVCFVPSGLRRLYPQSLQDLVGPILSQGGVLFSEYSSSQEMRKFHFLQRNRLIAGLGIATLLIQAGRRSGTLLTARSSLDHGKPVFVVPSHPLDVKSHGGLDLLMDGASLVRDEKDLSLLIDSEVTGYTRDSGYSWC